MMNTTSPLPHSPNVPENKVILPHPPILSADHFQTRLIREMTAGCLSCMVASAATNPLDIIKIKLQMKMKTLSSATPPTSIWNRLGYNNIGKRMGLVIEEAGWKGLIIPGLSAALIRELMYSSLRFGLYSHVKEFILKFKKNLYSDGQENSLWKDSAVISIRRVICAVLPYSLLSSLSYGNSYDESASHHAVGHPIEKSNIYPIVSLGFSEKLVAGMITGALGSAIANPTDLVKIRLQHEWSYKNRHLLGLSPSRYTSTAHAFSSILREEGFWRGWYRGTSASVIRAALLTGGQLASYDSAKAWLKRSGGPLWQGEESFKLHIICSIWSGLVAATFSAPADIVKTRLMCSNHSGIGSTLPKYRGFVHCFWMILRHEGVLGLYRGWLPSYLRLAPHFIISLPLNEQFRRLLGLPTL